MINFTEKGEKDLFHLTLPGYDRSLREVRQDTKSLKEKSWKNVVFWFVISYFCSDSFLIQYRTMHLGVALLLVGWALLHQLAIRKMPHRYDHRTM